ncbi:CPXCG motif-containing cysteine-rich protein [Motilimonas cestriensis]|uniref:CPXCG motif-containing cysteine-rich protein n=1 Tax=Motilimonas cestriensis TaxID=2742685 RepID=UPI003DA55F7C
MINFYEASITCPICGNHTDVSLDASNGDQDFYEDCRQCCHPIHIHLHANELTNRLEVIVNSDDE